MSVHKYKNIKAIRNSANLNWEISNIQPFFPPIEKLFKTNILESPSEYGIKFENEITGILNPDKITTATGEVEIHKKVTMLLSPFKWMQGDYGTSLSLPTTSEQSELFRNKLQSHNNAAYVGAIISCALSGCQHFPTIYGVFTGVAKNHQVDISEEYEDISERSWFLQNIGKTFNVKLADDLNNAFSHTRSNKVPVEFDKNTVLDIYTELSGIQDDSTISEIQRVFHEEAEKDTDDESDSSSVSTSYIFAIKSCDCSEASDEEDMDEEEQEPFAWATFTNIPVQVTLMEKYEGTLSDLFTSYPEPELQLAWLTQVMFGLAYAQRNFAFTHNDLHSNNVMFTKTDKIHLYYKCNDTMFEVPTHGYLIKIIDFERSIASIKLNGMKESKTFMSDHFSANEEAGGQYNSEPFYVRTQKEIKPNPSFDLVRLATSMFWDLFPEGPSFNYSSNHIFKFFMKWLTLPDGTSVMFGKDDPKHDRYHEFYLYKAIARYSKDVAIPRKEIMSLKPIYGIDSFPTGVPFCCVD
jgi:hypothetical protein